MDDEDYDDIEDLSAPHMDDQGGGDGDEVDEVLEVDTDDSTTRTSGKKLSGDDLRALILLLPHLPHRTIWRPSTVICFDFID